MKSSRKKMRRLQITGLVPFLLTLAFVVLLLLNSKQASQGIYEGLKICAGVIIPSLFPFMVISGFISGSKLSGYFEKLFSPFTKYVLGLPGELGAIVMMSFVGGYPVGAKLISEEYKNGRITKETAQKLLCFCVNAGPSFVIGAIGSGMLQNQMLGVILFIVHLLTSVTIAVLIKIFSPVSALSYREKKPDSYPVAFVESISSASSGLIGVSAYVVLFSAVTALFRSSGLINAVTGTLKRLIPFINSGSAETVIIGFLEVTNGCITASNLHIPSMPAFVSGLLFFSGVSIICQVMFFFRGLEIDFRPFLVSRIAGALISSFLFGIIYSRLGGILSVSALPRAAIKEPTANTVIITVCFVCMCFILMMFEAKGRKQ